MTARRWWFALALLAAVSRLAFASCEDMVRMMERSARQSNAGATRAQIYATVVKDCQKGSEDCKKKAHRFVDALFAAKAGGVDTAAAAADMRQACQALERKPAASARGCTIAQVKFQRWTPNTIRVEGVMVPGFTAYRRVNL